MESFYNISTTIKYFFFIFQKVKIVMLRSNILQYFTKRLKQYFNCNEGLEIFLTCFWNILCYVGDHAKPWKNIKQDSSILYKCECYTIPPGPMILPLCDEKLSYWYSYSIEYFNNIANVMQYLRARFLFNLSKISLKTEK